MSHTPGPWVSDGEIVGWMGGREPAVAVRSHIGGQVWSPVCMVHPDTTKQDPVYGRGGSYNPIDDARLIAAAPDLLAALKAVVAMLQKEAPGTKLNGREFDQLGIDAHNAIAKAEGR